MGKSHKSQFSGILHAVEEGEKHRLRVASRAGRVEVAFDALVGAWTSYADHRTGGVSMAADECRNSGFSNPYSEVTEDTTDGGDLPRLAQFVQENAVAQISFCNSVEELKAMRRAMAWICHPDRIAEEDRAKASLQMKKVNILIDEALDRLAQRAGV